MLMCNTDSLSLSLSLLLFSVMHPLCGSAFLLCFHSWVLQQNMFNREWVTGVYSSMNDVNDSSNHVETPSDDLATKTPWQLAKTLEMCCTVSSHLSESRAWKTWGHLKHWTLAGRTPLISCFSHSPRAWLKQEVLMRVCLWMLLIKVSCTIPILITLIFKKNQQDSELQLLQNTSQNILT